MCYRCIPNYNILFLNPNKTVTSGSKVDPMTKVVLCLMLNFNSFLILLTNHSIYSRKRGNGW